MENLIIYLSVIVLLMGLADIISHTLSYNRNEIPTIGVEVLIAFTFLVMFVAGTIIGDIHNGGFPS